MYTVLQVKTRGFIVIALALLLLAEGLQAQQTGPWDKDVLATLNMWDSGWVKQSLPMSTEPWTGILPRKDGVDQHCGECRLYDLYAGGTRHHIRKALEAGATREEILMTIKIASLLSIHSMSLGAPILLEEAKAAGIKPAPKQPVATPVCDRMKKAGQWNPYWDAFFEIDPAWTEAIIAASLPVYTSAIFSPKMAELLSIAIDASITHMYALVTADTLSRNSNSA
jgi:hypothetical protein